MDKVAYGTWQISEINKQQTNSVEYKCSAKSNHGMVVMHARLTDGLPLGLQRGGKFPETFQNFFQLSRNFGKVFGQSDSDSCELTKFRRIYRVCQAQSLLYLNKEERHKPKQQQLQQCCINTYIYIQCALHLCVEMWYM